MWNVFENLDPSEKDMFNILARWKMPSDNFDKEAWKKVLSGVPSKANNFDDLSVLWNTEDYECMRKTKSKLDCSILESVAQAKDNINQLSESIQSWISTNMVVAKRWLNVLIDDLKNISEWKK